MGGLAERMDALPRSCPRREAAGRDRAAVISRPLCARDEPTGNVDPTLGRSLCGPVIELNKSAPRSFIATHDITLMDQL